MKDSLEFELSNLRTQAIGRGNRQAEWLASTSWTRRQTMNDGQLCAAIVRIKAMLESPAQNTTRPGVVACRAILTHRPDTIHFGDSK